MIDTQKRYQTGLTLNELFPSVKNKCACGCGVDLPTNRKKWYSDECRQTAYIIFAIIKGDNSIIRQEVFKRDMGACGHCGVISDNWEADHIIPVIAGGGGCGLSNLQTLCYDCHKQKTYNLSHHSAISSQAVSILVNRCLYAFGQEIIRLPNISIEKQSLVLASVSGSIMKVLTYA